MRLRKSRNGLADWGINVKIGKILVPLAAALLLTACSSEPRQFIMEEHPSHIIDTQTKESTTDNKDTDNSENSSTTDFSESPNASQFVSNESSGTSDSAKNIETGLIREQILNGSEGEIHYSYYLPESYDGTRKFPMMVTLPGYDMMWFGENSSGSNVSWSGFRAWTELDEEMIVVSAQLTDWHKKSARQANELAQYFVDNFAVDTNRIYAAGYSAGGETMSQAVSLRPELYAAYLHGASQWDGEFAPLAESGVAVYVYMAESDEYYGSQKARDAYNGLLKAYRERGFSDDAIDRKLHLEIPNDEFFNSRGIYNYHGGGNIVFDDKNVLDWIISHTKQE